MPCAIPPVKRQESGMPFVPFVYKSYTLKLCRWIYPKPENVVIPALKEFFAGCKSKIQALTL